MHNRAVLNRCETAYKWIFGIYGIAFLASVVITISACLNSPMGMGTFSLLLFDGLICKCAMFVCGLLGVYKKNNRFAIAVPIILLINSVVCISPSNAVICFISVGAAVLNSIMNKKYHILENQEGFPYFNESLLEQEQHIQQQKIKDEYTLNYERLKKTSADSMGTVNLSTLCETETSDEGRYMDSL